MSPDRIREHFQNQAESCRALGSPFMAELCALLPDLLDEKTQVGRRVLAWPHAPGPDALALRLAGGLHALVLAGADKQLTATYPPHPASGDVLREAVKVALERHDGAIAPWLDKAPQTNEIARAAMLMPGLLAIAGETGLPFDLNEIGASAGLNLMVDHFGYRYGEAECGDIRSDIRLAPELRGGPVPVEGKVTIASRLGADIAPLNVADPRDRLRLRSYVWADQSDRQQRLDAAFRLAGRNPFAVKTCDAVQFVNDRLAQRKAGEVFVLAHTIMWQYLPELDQARIARAMRTAGEGATDEAPVAWVRVESIWPRDDCATLTLTLWPGGETRELARCDYHGRWIEWLGRA